MPSVNHSTHSVSYFKLTGYNSKTLKHTCLKNPSYFKAKINLRYARQLQIIWQQKGSTLMNS